MVDGPAEALADNKGVKEFYLGISSARGAAQVGMRNHRAGDRQSHSLGYYSVSVGLHTR